MKVVSSEWLVVSKGGFGFLPCALLFALGFAAAEAQPPEKITRIGLLICFC